MNSLTISVAAVEAARADIIAFTNKRLDELIHGPARQQQTQSVRYNMPTADDGRDPRNKIGHNLTERGVEILYRMFDDGAGYNRAGKMLNITQAAAKNRKMTWLKAGGQERTRLTLDIDE